MSEPMSLRELIETMSRTYGVDPSAFVSSVRYPFGAPMQSWSGTPGMYVGNHKVFCFDCGAIENGSSWRPAEHEKTPTATAGKP